MVLTEQDIKQIVTKIISELRHRPNNKIQLLADKIIALAQKGGGSISAAEVNSVNPYFESNKDLTVNVTDRRGADDGLFDYENTSITIARRMLSDARLKSTVVHELSHFIDQTRRTKIITDYLTNDNYHFDTCTYLFSPTEIQARLAGYGELIENSKYHRRLNVEDDATGLYLRKMKFYLNVIENATFNAAIPTNASLLVAWVMIFESSKRVLRRRNAEYPDVKPFVQFFTKITPSEFEKGKKMILNKYGKRLRDMHHKALKIKYDVVSTQ